MNILRAMRDPKLFAPWFKDPVTWHAWTAFLAALYALPMTPEQMEVYSACTGRQTPPATPQTEAWLPVGRRGGKSLILALIAVYQALFHDWTKHLVPGERGVVLVVAVDRRQAQSIMRYITALIEEVPLLAAKIERVTTESIDIKGRVSIEVGTASFRTVRGRTLIAALIDEIAFIRSEESANPDFEILDAIRPAMASIPGALLLCASSPYAKRGALWTTYRKWFGVADAPCLVWQAATRTMNPTISQAVVDAAMERDPASARAEFLGEFRNDLEAFVSEDVVLSCTATGRHELPPRTGVKYLAFADPSGGSVDAMTISVSHREGEKVILDAVRRRVPPFSPEDVVTEFCTLLKSYGVKTVVGDRYAGEWPRERFKLQGVTYELSSRTASDIYRDFLPLLNAGRVELLDNSRLRTELVGLERRTGRSGKDMISHPPGGHDDLVNSVAGALLEAENAKGGEAWTSASLGGLEELMFGMGGGQQLFMGGWP